MQYRPEPMMATHIPGRTSKITYRRNMQERDAKALVKSLNKQHKGKYEFEMERIGRLWDVVRYTWR